MSPPTKVPGICRIKPFASVATRHVTTDANARGGTRGHSWSRQRRCGRFAFDDHPQVASDPTYVPGDAASAQLIDAADSLIAQLDEA